MKKNNAIALIGHIAVILAPIMGITGIIMTVILICKGARFRQALGVIIGGSICFIITLHFPSPADWEQCPILAPIVAFIITGVPNLIIYYITREKNDQTNK